MRPYDEIPDEMLEKMSLEELDAMVDSYPEDVKQKADEILMVFGIALGEARANWCERIMSGEDIPLFIDESETKNG